MYVYVYIYIYATWSIQLCLTLCNPIDCKLPDPSVHGILQARVLEWVAISFSRGSSRPRDQTWVSCFAGIFVTTEPPGKPILYKGCIYAMVGILNSWGRDNLFPFGNQKQNSVLCHTHKNNSKIFKAKSFIRIILIY